MILILQVQSSLCIVSILSCKTDRNPPFKLSRSSLPRLCLRSVLGFHLCSPSWTADCSVCTLYRMRWCQTQMYVSNFLIFFSVLTTTFYVLLSLTFVPLLACINLARRFRSGLKHGAVNYSKFLLSSSNTRRRCRESPWLEATIPLPTLPLIESLKFSNGCACLYLRTQCCRH